MHAAYTYTCRLDSVEKTGSAVTLHSGHVCIVTTSDYLNTCSWFSRIYRQHRTCRSVFTRLKQKNVHRFHWLWVYTNCVNMYQHTASHKKHHDSSRAVRSGSCRFYSEACHGPIGYTYQKRALGVTNTQNANELVEQNYTVWRHSLEMTLLTANIVWTLTDDIVVPDKVPVENKKQLVAANLIILKKV